VLGRGVRLELWKAKVTFELNIYAKGGDGVMNLRDFLAWECRGFGFRK